MAPPQGAGVASDDPLVSWCDGATKNSIVDFVAHVTKAGGANYVAPEERIATFDNDGTLWAEQPFYFQLAFALDRVKALAPQHPEWQGQEPFKSALAGDLPGNFCSGMSGSGPSRSYSDRSNPPSWFESSSRLARAA